MYLMIQNPVASNPDVELMSTLGLSGSRGIDGRVGCFGSGFPYSLALLARHGLLERTKICLGTSVYTFTIDCKRARTASGASVDASTIVMKKQNGPTYPLNVSVNFGEQDWRSVTLAIREMVSNCVDGVYEYGGIPSRDVVITTDTPDEPRATRAKDGFIRVYIPLTDEIQQYVDDLHKHFRCLAPGYNASRMVTLNTDGGPARIYRKGVLVGTFGKSSLFHYNINDISINESRLVDSYTARDACAEAIFKCKDANIISRYLSSKLAGLADGSFERDVYISSMDARYIPDDCKDAVKDGIKRAIGERIVCTTDIAVRMCESKGCETAHVDEDLAKVLVSYGCVRTPRDVLNDAEVSGKVISEPTQAAQAMLDFVWTAMERCQVTLGKPKPRIACFSQHITSGAMAGYYRPGDGCIYIRRETADGVTTDGLDTIIHELNHYITGADDLTHEFTGFAHKFAASLLMERFTSSPE